MWIPTFARKLCGSARHVTHSDLSPSQGRRSLATTDTGNARAVRFMDSEPGPSQSSRLIAHASSPSPNRSHSLAHVSLKNTSQTRTKRQHPLSWSLSRSQPQSMSPPTVHLDALKPGTKRRKLERLSTVPAHEEAPPSLRKQVVSSGAENITPAGPNVNPTGMHGPDVDTENRKAHRRVLRARSRVIEEKLRRALFAPTSSPPDKVP